MSWDEKIYRYCERAGDPAFWAEPVNALTNVAFLIAAAVCAVAFARAARETRGWAEACLVLVVAVVGVGSFLFHTYATRWAAIADTAPIGIFMLAYFAYALWRFAGAPWWLTLAGLGGFVWSLSVARGVNCTVPWLAKSAAVHPGCLNGSVGYLPALVALVLIGLWLAIRRHPVWPTFAVASGVLAVSLAFRTLDYELCELFSLGGRHIGTHFLWHLLNATVLYLLVRGAIRHGRPT